MDPELCAMPISLTPAQRALALGGTAAAVLIGAFALGLGTGRSSPGGQNPAGLGSPATASDNQGDAGTNLTGAQLTAASGSGRITVTGTGTVTGVPNQLILSIGAQVKAASVSTALSDANQAVSRVTGALRDHGVAAADIQTADLYISPDLRGSAQTPNGYTVSESVTATLRQVSAAGGQIDAAVRAGGNAVTVNGISLNLTDTSSLLAGARKAAVANARTKASQYAAALGQPLGPVVSITDSADSGPFYPAAQSAAGAASSSVPISPGTQQLSVSVTVVYAVP
jgi:uncharacterized protein YggE